MFTRVKVSRRDEYLQIVENYRDSGRVRQRLVMYVGRYSSIENALQQMPRELSQVRRRATVAEHSPFWREHRKPLALREEADRLAARLEELRRLVKEHPDLLERDRARAARHERPRADRYQEFSRKRRLKPGD
jgi:hypothetical protein